MGAFDECLETIVLNGHGQEQVRGQYCTISIKFPVDPALVDEVAPIIQMSHQRVSGSLNGW